MQEGEQSAGISHAAAAHRMGSGCWSLLLIDASLESLSDLSGYWLLAAAFGCGDSSVTLVVLLLCF